MAEWWPPPPHHGEAPTRPSSVLVLYKVAQVVNLPACEHDLPRGTAVQTAPVLAPLTDPPKGQKEIVAHE